MGAPVFAAMLTNVLSAAGYRSGIGDIHPYLYSAPAGAFRDITTGSNGAYAAAHRLRHGHRAAAPRCGTPSGNSSPAGLA